MRIRVVNIDAVGNENAVSDPNRRRGPDARVLADETGVTDFNAAAVSHHEQLPENLTFTPYGDDRFVGLKVINSAGWMKNNTLTRGARFKIFRPPLFRNSKIEEPSKG